MSIQLLALNQNIQDVALNDIVLTRSGSLRIIDFNVYVNGEKVNDEVITETSYVLEDLPYNMNPGNEIRVTAFYDEGESEMSEAVYVKVTGETEVAGNFFEQDGTTPVLGGVIVLSGTDELGNEQSYTFVADGTGAFSGEILAGEYVAVASV